MLKRRLPLLLSALILAPAFVAGVAQLFILRFEAGDVYPPYSSLRADPLGARALFDALAQSPDVSVDRHLDRGSDLRNRSGETLLILGLPTERPTASRDIDDILRYAAAGNRLVLSFLPISKTPAAAPTPTPAEEPGETPAEPASPAAKALGTRLGLELKTKFETGMTATATSPGLESPISWHSSAFFDSLDAAWSVVYQIGARPVIVERSYGEGSIVLSTDSYLFSNEALRDERHPHLLAWFLGVHRQIVFEETHHGIAEDPGIMTLVHRYRLLPLLAVVILLGILFVWRNAIPFNPAGTREDDPGVVGGRDAARARIDLLRRSVPASAISAVCADRWKQSFNYRAGSAVTAAVDAATAAEQALPPRQRNPIETYGRIARALRHTRFQ